MIHIKKIKEFAKKEGKRLSKKAIEEIKKILEEKAEKIILHAKRNAGFAGRKTILKEDIGQE